MSLPTYAELTREDANPLKRVLQRRRLADALRAGGRNGAPESIVDYGGGDGALLRMAAGIWPQARLTCFEPWDRFAAEARAALADLPQALVVEDAAAIGNASADLVFCTEVFEHLPDAQTEDALAEIDRILAPGGRLVVGVPVELWGPALAKGLFRILRRPDEFDGQWRHVLSAAGGRAPSPRPEVPIGAGLAYHPHHAGFDHRPLLARIAARFEVERIAGSPFGVLPLGLNNELYMTARKPISA